MSTDQSTDNGSTPEGRRIGRPRRVSDEEIYVATLLALGDSGSGFSLGEVARRVGVTGAAIRQRFGSRRRLIVAMAHARVEHTRARFEQSRTLSVPRLEALEAALVAELSLVLRPEQVAHVFSAYTELGGDPEVAAIFREEVRMMVRETERLLTDAVRAGELRVEVTQNLAAAVVAAAEGTMLLWSLDPVGDVADRVRQAVRIVVGAPT